MAPTIASSGNSPTTLTLMPFHTDSQPKQTQHYRLPKAAQQQQQQQQQTPPAITVSSPYRRNHRTPNHAPSLSSSVSTSSSQKARCIAPNASSLSISRPTVVNARNTARAHTTTTMTALTRVPDTYQPKSPSSTRSSRRPITTVAKVHAIAPIGPTSIDSILHADSSKEANKDAVPDRIRPKAEAIK